jgi:hypothetical protein
LGKEGGIFTNKDLPLERLIDEGPVLCVFIKDGRHLIPPPFSFLPALPIGVFSSHPEPALAASMAKTGDLSTLLPKGGRGLYIRAKRRMILGGMGGNR